MKKVQKPRLVLRREVIRDLMLDRRGAVVGGMVVKHDAPDSNDGCGCSCQASGCISRD